MDLIYFIVAIASLILIHEAGHFIAARLVKVDVEEFGIGFPPRITSLFTIKNTNYTLNWIPFGGFVRLKGMDDPEIPGGFAAAQPWRRIVILIAGPLMNILMGILIYTIIFIRLGEPVRNQVVVVEVASGSPAHIAQLEPGDLILSINDQPISSTDALRVIIYDNLDQPIEMIYDRSGIVNTTVMTPRSNPPEGEGAIGIIMDNPRQAISPFKALALGSTAVKEFFVLILTIPSQLISGEISSDQGRLVGYKGMYDIFSNFREQDASLPTRAPAGINTLNFFGTITLSLALLNLFPLPALDGGRILFILPEIIIRKRVPVKFEYIVNFIGFSIMILILIYVNIQDFVDPITLP